VSLQPPGTTCASRKLAHRRAVEGAERRPVLWINGVRGGTRASARYFEPPSASAAIHHGRRRWIHPDRVDRSRLSVADVVPAAWQDQLQRFEEDAMNCRTFPRALALATLAIQAAAPQYAGDIVHLTLSDAVHLAISQNRTLKIARLK